MLARHPLGKGTPTMSAASKECCHSSVVEHCFGKAEVDGSIPSDSTNPLKDNDVFLYCGECLFESYQGSCRYPDCLKPLSDADPI